VPIFVQRVVLPVAVALIGVAAVVYGATRHFAQVTQRELVEKQVQEKVTRSIRIPVPVGMAPSNPWDGGDGGQEQPSPGEGSASGAAPDDEGQEVPPPGMTFQTVKQEFQETVTRSVPEIVVKDVREPDIIRDITVGGMVLKPEGLWRTYDPGGPPPLLCPS
jgi:hypothetical protein